jgi:hypothetical protein
MASARALGASRKYSKKPKTNIQQTPKSLQKTTTILLKTIKPQTK